jgi:hypothetical protein
MWGYGERIFWRQTFFADLSIHLDPRMFMRPNKGNAQHVHAGGALEECRTVRGMIVKDVRIAYGNVSSTSTPQYPRKMP